MFKRNKQKYTVHTGVDVQKFHETREMFGIKMRSHAGIVISKVFEWDSEHFRDIKTGTFDSKILTVRLKHQPKDSSKSRTIGLIKLNSSVLCGHVNCLASGVMSLSHHKKILKTAISMTIQTRWLKVGHELVKNLFLPSSKNESKHVSNKSKDRSERMSATIGKFDSSKDKDSESQNSADDQPSAHLDCDDVMKSEKNIFSLSNLDKFICRSCNSSVNSECSNVLSDNCETSDFDHVLPKMTSTTINSKSMSNLPSLPVKQLLTTLCHSRSQDYSLMFRSSYDGSTESKTHGLATKDRTSVPSGTTAKQSEGVSTEKKTICANDKEVINNTSELENLQKVKANNPDCMVETSFDLPLDQEKKGGNNIANDTSLNVFTMLDYRIKHGKCLFCGCNFFGPNARDNTIKSFSDLCQSYQKNVSRQYRAPILKDLIDTLAVDKHFSSIVWILFAACLIFTCYFALGSDRLYLGLNVNRIR